MKAVWVKSVLLNIFPLETISLQGSSKWWMQCYISFISQQKHCTGEAKPLQVIGSLLEIQANVQKTPNLPRIQISLPAHRIKSHSCGTYITALWLQCWLTSTKRDLKSLIFSSFPHPGSVPKLTPACLTCHCLQTTSTSAPWVMSCSFQFYFSIVFHLLSFPRKGKGTHPHMELSSASHPLLSPLVP